MKWEGGILERQCRQKVASLVKTEAELVRGMRHDVIERTQRPFSCAWCFLSPVWVNTTERWKVFVLEEAKLRAVGLKVVQRMLHGSFAR